MTKGRPVNIHISKIPQLQFDPCMLTVLPRSRFVYIERKYANLCVLKKIVPNLASMKNVLLVAIEKTS
jgi:hypothetical protein